MLIGISFKTWFSHARTVEWLRAAAATARGHDAVASGAVRLFAMPQFPTIPAAVGIAGPAGIAIGAQDIAEHDDGPWTGEVTGPVLAEVGATMVEVGHAERRAHFGENDDVVAAKTLAALRTGLTPVLCVGETERDTPQRAADAVRAQIDSALAPAGAAGIGGRLVVAYEPVWAIGAPQPAPPEHVREIGSALRAHLAAGPGGEVIYGGSAGPGLLPRIADGVDGMFLGRFAHDPAALGVILDEVLALGATPADAR
ncbi:MULTISPECIES: triose-phosphate isomerase family protein [Pseudonocardia]|uniref:Triosephosphate isomerase n=2 Tax=Pseudonocardia TaxID=1847 RepID=A0A1Y2N3F3_PSEAH|nr:MULTISPECIES: triose-phosphate isomerase family protein [Pseudonocardia]OSY41428.1 Triosephosphate isomerase [Pseudonocardia autotrophica]TDN71385.1 triosephosphate isomerase [Pseudonocardia autotrophica]BBG02061.1 triosephosphate isomerase [Pseudonocardia autotrophica]GEC24075.1 triosephosphate isomerase [Pseudonocardia saturnea]